MHLLWFFVWPTRSYLLVEVFHYILTTSSPRGYKKWQDSAVQISGSVCPLSKTPIRDKCSQKTFEKGVGVLAVHAGVQGICRFWASSHQWYPQVESLGILKTVRAICQHKIIVASFEPQSTICCLFIIIHDVFSEAKIMWYDSGMIAITWYSSSKLCIKGFFMRRRFGLTMRDPPCGFLEWICRCQEKERS